MLKSTFWPSSISNFVLSKIHVLSVESLELTKYICLLLLILVAVGDVSISSVEHVDQVPLLCTLLHGDPSWGGWDRKPSDGGLEHQFYFPRNIGNVIIPTDFHIFQRGGTTTNQKPSDVEMGIGQNPFMWLKPFCMTGGAVPHTSHDWSKTMSFMSFSPAMIGKTMP